MEKQKVIHPKNSYARLPLHTTILYTFLLHHFDCPQWAWTLFIVFYSFLWIVMLYKLFTQECIDIFNSKEVNVKKSVFQDRLDNYLSSRRNNPID